jgi:hypothetical protein
MSTYVTRSGRARPIGRVTRLSFTVGRPKGVKPLPLDMCVRPQALAPLPRHPECVRTHPATCAMLRWRDTVSPAGYGLGHGLSGRGEWTLYVKGCDEEYRHHDSAEAFGWRMAAHEHGYEVTITRR